SKSEVYNRLALGQYLHAQYEAILEKISGAGITVEQFPNSEVVDIEYHPKKEEVTLKIAGGTTHTFSKVVVATGHVWTEKDDVESGNYASPWPIQKILPEEGTFHNFKIGTLGASLSAFDVVSSLSRRHGKFETDKDGKMTFHPAEGAEDFSIAMHAANGWLPNLQYEQEEPMREIYRHVSREEIFNLLDGDGYLRIETFFDKVCRPALTRAFKKDKMPDLVEKLADETFTLTGFVETMSRKHEYGNAFEGMRFEMEEAKDSVEHKKPIHWKEVMDDLIYALNFHAELMPAEDHLLFHKEIMPFLMNVIAAMPLPSGHLLLALYDAGRLEIVSGYATVAEKHKKGITTIEVKDGEATYAIDYKMFIHCGGQKPVGLKEYPFKSLVEKGVVRRARSKFIDTEKAGDILKTDKKELVCPEQGDYYYYIGGLDIDASYRVIGKAGEPNDCINDITFTHTTGLRPYSYGLQACSATSQILVEAWIKSLESDVKISGDIEEVARLYAETEEL
uniref:FAD/NAD(P)-binding protein n=1 Tax=Persicitalea sp. TaxID=3100273 RepID=UPI00359388E7